MNRRYRMRNSQADLHHHYREPSCLLVETLLQPSSQGQCKSLQRLPLGRPLLVGQSSLAELELRRGSRFKPRQIMRWIQAKSLFVLDR